MLRIVGELLHSLSQLRCADTKVLRHLHIGYAPILDQAHRLSLNSRVNFRLSMTPSGPIKTPNSVSSKPGSGNLTTQ